MSRPRDYKVKEFIAVIPETCGIISTIANKLGVTRRAVYNYRAKFPEIAQAIEDERNRCVDTAESKIFAAVNEGEEWAVRFVLARLGRDRGWGLQGSGGPFPAITGTTIILLPDNNRPDQIVDAQTKLLSSGMDEDADWKED